MTDDQRDKLNRFLAERVLGWKFNQPPPDRSYYCRMAKTLDAPVWISMPGGEWQCGLCNGSPDFGRWADCEPLLDKIERDGWKWMFSGRIVGETYEFSMSRDIGGEIISQESSARTEALCLAVGRAYGWKV